MRLWNFKYIISLIVILTVIAYAGAIDICPKYVSCQSGGGMGAVSIGTGWKYGGHCQWETELFAGLVPKYDSGSTKVSFALKENFIPWRIRLIRKLSLAPLTTSFYFTTLLCDRVWTRLPQRYPHGYYKLPTKIRANISLGQRIMWSPSMTSCVVESISLYYEIGTCDIYVLSAAGNGNIKPHDLLQLCIGVRIDFKR